MMRFAIGILVVFTVFQSGAWAGDETVLLGMVEDVPGTHVGEGHSTKLRALFTHNQNGWHAFPTSCKDATCLRSITRAYPSEASWYVGIDGRQLGKVMTRVPADFNYYSHIGLLDIVGGKAPEIGTASHKFSGFVYEAVRRPLVAVSKPMFRDPDRWKRETIAPTQLRQAMAALHEKWPSLCKIGTSDNQPFVSFQYGQSDLDIHAHRFAKGWQLMTIEVKNASYCDYDGPGDGAFDSQMFAISPDGVAHYLGPGLMLVDAGDYDDDGHAEIIMALSLYNRGGYVLYSDSFVEQARFVFGYH